MRLKDALLVRLYYHYQQISNSSPYTVLLHVNYRTCNEILQFINRIFYGNCLTPAGNQPVHQKFYPLSFHACFGEETNVFATNSYFNEIEASAVVQVVADIVNSWSDQWEKEPMENICVLSHYFVQVSGY